MVAVAVIYGITMKEIGVTVESSGPDDFDIGPEASLVTGGAGFIGSNLVNYLDSIYDHHFVIALDDLSFGRLDNVPESTEVQPVVGDVGELGGETAEWILEPVDTIYHLAATSSTKFHSDDPEGGCRNNVENFVHLMELALEHDVNNVVFASSSTVYGNPDTPTSEEHPLNPTTRYAASKAARESYAEVYRELGLNVTIARFFSTYQGYGYREGHKGEHGNIISQFAEKMANGERPVVYGDGTQTRDFVHVSDTVRALHEMRGINDVYNVCTGESTEFNEIIEMLNDGLGTEIEPEYVEPQVDGEYVSVQKGDRSKLTEATEWEPQVDTEEGVRRVVQPYM